MHLELVAGTVLNFSFKEEIVRKVSHRAIRASLEHSYAVRLQAHFMRFDDYVPQLTSQEKNNNFAISKINNKKN